MKRFTRALTTCLCLLGILMIAAPGMKAETPGNDNLRPPAQDQIQILTLTDGSSLHGRIVEVRDEELVFESSVGTMTISRDRIKEIREVPATAIRDGDFWFPNPNRTRMYIGPTARMQPKGTGYFADIYLFFPSVTYGFSNNFTFSAGMSIFPGLGIDEQLFYFTPKIGLAASDKLSVAASALITVIPEWSDDDFDQSRVLGIVFGVATYGTDDASITTGLGFGYVDEDFGDKPAVIVGGEYRVARRISLVSENWVLPDVDPPLISYGVRFFGEGIAVDLAFMNVASDDAIFPGIPILGFVWNF